MTTTESKSRKALIFFLFNFLKNLLTKPFSSAIINTSKDESEERKMFDNLLMEMWMAEQEQVMNAEKEEEKE